MEIGEAITLQGNIEDFFFFLLQLKHMTYEKCQGLK